jgi:NAD(P)-dependent dehydrogenase (short-subunit alcohol dehydrogenase family)
VSSLDGKIAIVTGASRGIGAAIASTLASHGAHVVRVARSLAEGEHVGFLDLRCDLTDPSQVERLGDRVLADVGTPEIVVNGAGGFVLRSLEATAVAELDAQLAVNLRGPFAMARTFLPPMRQAGRGSFVIIGSVADHVGLADNSAYAASKFAVRGLHETLVAEYRGTGVRLTLVSPGPTDTTLWDPFDPDHRQGFTRRVDMLRAEDVADAVLFVVTRPAQVHVDWLRLSPVGATG